MQANHPFPTELVLLIAAYLKHSVDLPPWSISRGKGAHVTSFANKRPSTHPSLLSLSSACQSYRILLSPLIWNQIYITHPSQLGRLRSLIQFYTSFSNPNQTSSPPDSTDQRLPFPLPFVEHLFIQLDDRFRTLPQDILCQLLRNGMNFSLKSIAWNSEALPSPALWLALESHTDISTGIESVKIGEEKQTSGRILGLRSLEVDCKTFWGGHPNLSRLKSLQHLRLTGYDSHLLPTQLPNLLSSLNDPLLSLSLSTSKTSLFHELSPTSLLFMDQQRLPMKPEEKLLLEQTKKGKGPFSRLTELDTFPVTPERPLDQSLIQSGKTLKHLRLCLDVSGAFTNFDNLWVSLTGKMEALESLDVEPYPQQNTAPSFQTFVESCPKLDLINGRRIDQLPPCLTPFDPDNRTSALAY